MSTAQICAGAIPKLNRGRGSQGRGSDWNESSIATAISSDGLNFTSEKVVIPPKVADPDVHLLADGTYRMFLGYGGGMATATSPDGLQCMMQGTVAKPSDLGVAALADPSALPLANGSYRIYFGGGSEAQPGIVSAVWTPPPGQK